MVMQAILQGASGPARALMAASGVLIGSIKTSTSTYHRALLPHTAAGLCTPPVMRIGLLGPERPVHSGSVAANELR